MRAATRAAARAAALLCLAVLPAGPATASEAGGQHGADTSRPGDAVTLSPASGAAGTIVAVRAECASPLGHGAVFSPAFARPAALRPAAGGGAMVAEATVRRGLSPGHGYLVTANCSDAESLTTTFVAPDASRAAAGPLPAAARRAPADGSVDGVALAFGGGLAAAALAGYALTARRAASRRRLRAASPARRR